MSQLLGKSSLSIDNAPQTSPIKPEKLNLISKRKDFVLRSYRFNPKLIKIIDELEKRFSEESNIQISKGKVIEIAIHSIRKKTLAELLAL